MKARAEKYAFLLADDHAVMRERLARLLANAPDIEIVEQASNGLEAVALAFCREQIKNLKSLSEMLDKAKAE